jgi:asparagine synthase (glutamine-hydrolysing)
MCGIYGELRAHPRPPPAGRSSFIELAGRALAHRGPEGSGVWHDAFCSLGHRRLKVIDLSENAAQPMRSASGRSVITYNGEIYNYLELRSRMTSPPGGFRSSSDTEVLVEWLERHGASGLKDALGMFAFALWDAHERELVLVRDRLGKKPLFYSHTGDTLRFASEIPSLLADGSLPRKTSLDRIAEFLQYGFIASPQTAFVGIESLPPGSWLRAKVTDHGLRIDTGRYWQLPTDPEPAADWQPWLDEFQATLENAIQLRLRSDVPIGAFLSGGMDSSVVSLLAHRALQGGLKTFTVDFENDAFSEGRPAREVANHIGTQHHELHLRAGSLDDLPRLVRTYGNLFGDPSALPTMAICREMKKYATVVLSGDGGDELLGGYTRYRFAEPRDGGASSRVGPWLYDAAKHYPVWLRGDSRLSLYHPDWVAAYQGSMRSYPLHDVPPLFGQTVVARDVWREAFERHSQRPPLFRVMAADAELYLPEDNLVKVDRASMAAAVEVRSPLLDHRLFELVSRARPEWLRKGDRGKLPLAALYARDLPADVFSRKKMGFGVPLADWMHDYGVDRIEQSLLGRDARIRSVLDPRIVSKLVRGFRWRTHHFAGRIWHLLLLEEWLSQFGPSLS